MADLDGLPDRRRGCCAAAASPTRSCTSPAAPSTRRRAGRCDGVGVTTVAPAARHAYRPRTVRRPAGGAADLLPRSRARRTGRRCCSSPGLSLDLTSWPRGLLDGFVERGFRVIRFDNRDVGRSEPRARTGPRARCGSCSPGPGPDAYDLADMAADTVRPARPPRRRAASHLVGHVDGRDDRPDPRGAAPRPGRHPHLDLLDHRAPAASGSPPGRRSCAWPGRRRGTVEESVAAVPVAARPHRLDRVPARRGARAGVGHRAWHRGDGARAREAVARQIGAIQASGDRTAEPAPHHRAHAGRRTGTPI